MLTSKNKKMHWLKKKKKKTKADILEEEFQMSSEKWCSKFGKVFFSSQLIDTF